MLVKLIQGSGSLVKQGPFMREKASDPKYLGPPVMIAKFVRSLDSAPGLARDFAWKSRVRNWPRGLAP